jgi:hypothetical protein
MFTFIRALDDIHEQAGAFLEFGRFTLTSLQIFGAHARRSHVLQSIKIALSRAS